MVLGCATAYVQIRGQLGVVGSLLPRSCEFWALQVCKASSLPLSVSVFHDYHNWLCSKEVHGRWTTAVPHTACVPMCLEREMDIDHGLALSSPFFFFFCGMWRDVGRSLMYSLMYIILIDTIMSLLKSFLCCARSQKQLEEAWVIVHHVGKSGQQRLAGTWRQELNQRPWKNAVP